MATLYPDSDQMARGQYLRKFALFVSPFMVLLGALAQAQQIDIAAGGGTLLSTTSTTNSASFQQPPEKGSTYITVSGDYVRAGRRLGLELETSWRYRRALYPYNGETYRPFLSAANVLFQPRITRKIGLDLLGGVGIASTRFYGLNSTSCSSPTIGCVNYIGSNHFMEDLGAGVRYNLWRHFFVRPELRYYHIQNNQEFNSSNVFRASVSLGYTIHSN
jgi:opacity protein-like surface antigen